MSPVDNSGVNPLADFSAAMVRAVEKAASFTVMVSARRRRPASGVVYAADLVLTADHVIESEDNIRVFAEDMEAHKANLIGRDPVSDLALLRLEDKSLAVAKRSASDGAVGQLGLTVARPDSGGVQAGLALISAIGGPVRTMRGGFLKRYFRLDATPLPGFSGGALVDATGDLLGVNTSGLAMDAFISLPAGLAWETAALLEQNGRVKRGYLGIRSQPVDIPQAARAALKREQASGLLLVSVEEDSPAGKAGLQVGDILVAIAGQPVGDPDDLLVSLSGDIAGKKTDVQVLRGGQPVTLEMTVGER